jgi:RNA polymerase sigma-70 factor (ECF subfamily)
MLFKRKYTEDSDDRLMEMVARGNDKAFGELVTRYQSPVLNLAFRFLGDPQEAKDIAQDTFLRVFEAADRYQPTTQFKSFVFRIARNLCVDHIRRKKPVYMDELPERAGSSDPLSELEREQLSEALSRALLTLPESQRMAVLLHHFEGLKYSEIAEVMETSVSAVESLLVRAKRALREKMKPFR